MQFSGKPDVYELKNGTYECSSCVPPLRVTADGTDQAVTGHDYYDHISVKVLSPTAVETTMKKAGKVIATTTDTVSADGSKLVGKFTSYGGEKPVTGGYTDKRTAPAAPGAHAISGSWQTERMDMSELMRTVKFESTQNGLRMTWNGLTTDAKFDGQEHPTVGDPGNTMVTLKKTNNKQIEEIDRRNGKVFDVVSYTVAADGKSISVVDEDPAHGTKTTYVLDKLP
jgi:hypothetical protein